MKNEVVKSVLVEVNEELPDEITWILDYMRDCGFAKVTKRHPPDFDDAYYRPVFNYLFERR